MSAEDILSIIQVIEDMESSSSSEDEDDIILIGAILNELEMETHAKIRDYVDNVVSEYSDNDFKKHFRLERVTCVGLTEIFEQSGFCPSYNRNQGGGTKIYPAEDYVLVFLFYAGNKATMREAADKFGIAESTVFKIVNTVMDFLVKNAATFIKFPTTTAAKEAVADEFFKLAGIPNVIGCVDGTYIPLNTPAHKIKSTYINRHDQVSVTMQGICDANRKYFDVVTGIPSKVHDSRIFKMSLIAGRLANICEEGRFHILADGAYELREWVITPYRCFELTTPARIQFNKKFCSTRVVVENSFANLKKRFRQMKSIELRDVDRITKFIISCCVLHNICIDANDTEGNLVDSDSDDEDDEPMDEDEIFDDEEITSSARLLRQRGVMKRNTLCSLFR